jgi:hypothetical protein
MIAFLLTGCAQPPHLSATPRLLTEVASAPQRPVQLPEAERRDVLHSLEANPGGAARAFADPELRPDVWASFWRSPLSSQVDRNRLLLVRYADDGTYVYLGFARDGDCFTDGRGGLLMEPPWSQ